MTSTSPYAWQGRLVERLRELGPDKGIMIVQPPGSGKTRGIAKIFQHFIVAPSIKLQTSYDFETDSTTEVYVRANYWKLQTLIVAEPFRALARQVANELYETLRDDDAWLFFQHSKSKLNWGSGSSEKERQKRTKLQENISRAWYYFFHRQAVGNNEDRLIEITDYMNSKNFTLSARLGPGDPVRKAGRFVEVQEGTVSRHIVPYKPLVVGTYENISAMVNNLEAVIRFGDEPSGEEEDEREGNVPGHNVRVIVIDEFHNITKDRGIFIDNIIHAAAMHNKKYPEHPIAVVLLSGTAPDSLKRNIYNSYPQFEFEDVDNSWGLIKESGRPFPVKNVILPGGKVLLINEEDPMTHLVSRAFNLAGYFGLIRQWKSMPPGKLAVMFAPTKSVAEALAIVTYAFLRSEGAYPVHAGSSTRYSPRLVSTSGVYSKVFQLARLSLKAGLDFEAAIGDTDLWLDYGIYLDHANSNDQAIRESFQDEHSFLRVRFLIATTTIAEGFNIRHAHALALDYENEDGHGNFVAAKTSYWDSAKYGQMLGRIGRYQPGLLYSGHSVEELEELVTKGVSDVQPEMSFEQKMEFVWTMIWNTAGASLGKSDGTTVVSSETLSYDAKIQTFWDKGSLEEVLEVYRDLELVEQPPDQSSNTLTQTLSNGKLLVGPAARILFLYLNDVAINKTASRIPVMGYQTALLAMHEFLWALKESEDRFAQMWRGEHGVFLNDYYWSFKDDLGRLQSNEKWALAERFPEDFTLGWLLVGEGLCDKTNFESKEFQLARAGFTKAQARVVSPSPQRMPHALVAELIAGSYRLEPDDEESEDKKKAPDFEDIVFAYTYAPRWLASLVTDGKLSNVSLFSVNMSEIANHAEVAITLASIFPLIDQTANTIKSGFMSVLRLYELVRLARFSFQHGWPRDYRVFENFQRQQKSRWARVAGEATGVMSTDQIRKIVQTILGRRLVLGGPLKHMYSKVTLRIEYKAVGSVALEKDFAEVDLAELLEGWPEGVESAQLSWKKYDDSTAVIPIPVNVSGANVLAKERLRETPRPFINLVYHTTGGQTQEEYMVLSNQLPYGLWLRHLSTIIEVE